MQFLPSLKALGFLAHIIMNFFEYQDRMYGGEAVAMDDALGEYATKIARQQAPKAQKGTEKSARQIVEFSDKGKILSGEELMEHRKHCRAKPGNCPFEKAVDEADDITPNDIKVTKQDVFNRLAAVLTQLFQVAKNLAKPAIAEPKEVENEANPNTPSEEEKTTSDKAVSDEALPDEPNEDAKTVAEIIEGGIEKMVELAKGKGCTVNMDENKGKYTVIGPQKEEKDGTSEG